MTLLFLVIDDCPGRYDEFFRELDERGHRWVLTHDVVLVEQLFASADVVVLDHDMPRRDGRARAADIVRLSAGTAGAVRPVVIASTTGLEEPPAPGQAPKDVRLAMVRTLEAGGVPVLLCPADHHGCEREWLFWAVGVVAGAQASR